MVELNSPASEGRPYLRRDGREIYFKSNRSGSFGIWVSTRSSTTGPWSPLVDSIISTAYSDVIAITTPGLSWDAKTLFVGVVRPSDTGNIFVSAREELEGKQ